MIDESQLMTDLEAHYGRAPAPDEHAEISILARSLSAEADATALAQAAELVATERSWAATLLLVARTDRVHGTPPRARTWMRVLPLALAAIVLLASSAVVHFARLKIDERDLLEKGAADAFFVAARRSNQTFRIAPNGLLATGDRLGLFYSAREGGFLSVLSRDALGNVNVLFPLSGHESAAIAPGLETSLPDGAIASAGKGCEWFVAIFSAQAIPLAWLRERVERSSPDARSCALALKVEGARSVVVLPVTR